MVWKECFGFEKYEVNELGEIRNMKGLILKTRLDNRGYDMVRIYRGKEKHSRRISKLVWESFNEKRCKQTIDHIDRDKHNNNINNLRCISSKENSQNRNNYSNKLNKYNLTEELKRMIMTDIKKKNKSLSKIQNEYGIPTNYTSSVLKRGTWNKYLDDGQGI